jgi:hypothetical protein
MQGDISRRIVDHIVESVRRLVVSVLRRCLWLRNNIVIW